MSLISSGFLFFCIIVLVTFFVLPKRLQVAWLLVASYAFYLTFGWPYVLALATLTMLNFLVGLQVERKPVWRWPGLVINIASFGLLKIVSGPYGFPILEELFPGLPPELAALLLPIGFSFYVLQAISYLLDIANGQIKAERSLLHFALYMAWFPKLISGPIERAGYFLPQLKTENIVNNDSLGRAFGLILIGLIRKIVIADHLALIRPTDLFIQPDLFSPVERTLWLVVTAFTLYNDFAGYTSLMRGVSLLFGIELSINFRQPFFANTVGEFWNRWHISLSTWLRDYIFYPLQRWMSKQKIHRGIITFVAPLVTMLFSGFWHGAYLTMMGWGGLHGLYLAAQQLLKIRTSNNRLLQLGQILSTFALTTVAWVPFFATSSRLTVLYFLPTTTAISDHFHISLLVDILVLIGLSIWVDYQESSTQSDAFFLAWRPARQTAAIGVALFILVLFSGSAVNLSNFVYQGF